MKVHCSSRLSIKGIAIYYILSCLISWTIWLPLVLNKQLGYSIHVLSYQHYLASIGPTVSAIICVLYYGGLKALKEVMQNIFTIKGRSKWIWFGVLSPVVMF